MLRFVDSFSKYLNNQNHRSTVRGSGRSSKRSLSYQNLESRCLLAGITFDVDTGNVLIEGDTTDDIAEVRIANDMVLVSLTGFADETFAVAEVSTLRFEAGLGNDQFSNFTSIPSLSLIHI